MTGGDTGEEREIRRLQSGLFLLTMAVLLFQVSLTRVFAIMMWHHFAYLIVSLALLGFGISGSLLSLWQARRGRLPRAAPGLAGLAGAAICVSWYGICSVRVDSLELWRDPVNLLGLLAAFAVVAIPFTLAGAAIAISLLRSPGKIGPLYRADLLGSAAGAALAPWVLARWQLESAVALSGVLALAGGFALSPPRLFPRILAASGFLAGLLFLGLTLGLGSLPGLDLPALPFAPNKQVAHSFPGGSPERILPSAQARVEVSRPLINPMAIGGQFGDLNRQRVEMRGVTQDGTAPTVLYANAAELARFPSLGDTNAAAGYLLRAVEGLSPPRVCVIGVGGGADVMVALAHEAREVVGVEINAAMIRMVTRDYAGYIGRLFDDPKLSLVRADGRSYLRRSQESFDLIQLSGVDTFTALSTGAYTLSESYLYTVEAVQDFYRRLAPGGVVHYSRFLLDPPLGPRETIRLANVVREALFGLGVEDPWRHVLVLQAQGWASTLICRDPVTLRQSKALRDFARKERFRGLVFDPHRGAEGPGEAALMSQLHYEEAARAGLTAAAPLLPKLLREQLLLDAVVSSLGTGFRKRDLGDEPGALERINEIVGAAPASCREAFSARLEAAYEAGHAVWDRRRSEFAKMRREFEGLLRGGPAERTRVLKESPYDLTPCTDDAPFFFNYYRWSGLFEAPWSSGKWKGSGEYHPEVPVGQMVIWSSLFIIGLCGLLLILLPLRGLATGGKRLHRSRVFAYFAGLGLGFMFVEISLMQRLILYLGEPTLSVSVVLGGLLFFSGLGAGVSARLGRPSRARMLLLALVIPAAIYGLARYLPFILTPSLGAGTGVRVLVALATIAPVGFLLGIPFPLGVRALRESAQLLPWAWAINGLCSVFASILATLVAMAGAGFSGVQVAAAGLYLICLPLLPTTPAEKQCGV